MRGFGATCPYSLRNHRSGRQGPRTRGGSLLGACLMQSRGLAWILGLKDCLLAGQNPLGSAGASSFPSYVLSPKATGGGT
jgi:hypothetical protein